LSQRHEQSARAVRVTSAVAVGAGVVLAFAALGAPGLAQTSSSAAQYQYGKTTLCHHAGPHGKRVTITVGDSAVPAHLRHGDTIGACPATPGEDRGEKKHAAAKAGAAKAAKAKAEREHGAAKSESGAKAKPVAKSEAGAKAKPAEKTGAAAKPKAAKSGSEREPRTDHASPEPGKGRPPAKQKDDSAARGGPPAKTAQPAAPQPAPAPAPAAGGNEDKGNHGQGNGQGNAGDNGNHGDGSNGKGHGKG